MIEPVRQPQPENLPAIRLELSDLALQIDGRMLCEGLSATMHTTQSWCVLGPNGTGKTTLLHTLAGLRAPQHGDVLLNNQAVKDYSLHELAQLRSILFQRNEEPFPSTVIETIMSGRHPHIPRWGSETEDDRQLANELLTRVGLSDMQHRDITTLSGGEHQRVDIATVFAQQTPLRLFDEPASNLDLRHQAEMLDLITRGDEHLNILVLHDINHATRYCTHALLMFEDGHVEQGSIDEILEVERLETLYTCPLKVIEDDEQKWFFTR